MKIASKAFAALLCVAMILASFAGCTSTAPSSAPSPTAAPETPAAATAETAAPEETQAPALRTVKILCESERAEGWPTVDEANLSFQAFNKAIAARGLKIDYELIDYDQIKTVVQTRMAAAVELPDIIADTRLFSDVECLQWAANGLILNIKEAVDKYDEDGSIFAFYEEKIPGALARVTADDGGVYWFSYLYNVFTVDMKGNPIYFTGTPWTLSLRYDWLDNIGAEYKNTMTRDELFDTLLAFNKQDANGNGKKDEIAAIHMNQFFNGIATSFGLTSNLLCGIDNQTGKVFSNFYRDEFKDYIAYMKKLYDNGLYDTAELGEGMRDQLVADNRGSIVFHYSGWSDFEPTISAAPDAQYAPFLLTGGGNDEKFNVLCDTISMMPCHYMVTSKCSDVEAVVDLFDYVYTPEYELLNYHGIEGVSYHYDENKLIEDDFDKSKDHSVYPLFYNIGLYALPTINCGKSKYDPNKVDEGILKIKTEWYNWYMGYSPNRAIVEERTQLVALPATKELDKLNEIRTVLETYAGELLIDLVLGKKSVDDLGTYITEMESLGMTDYLNIMQARLDRFNAVAK